MQPIAVLSAVFALLVTYLEWVSPNPQLANQPLVQAVVRDHVVAQVQTKAVTPTQPARTALVAKTAKPLNLELPTSVEAIQQSLGEDQQQPLLNGLFEERTASERVTYNAELVYDRETGEDITGGKVNIKIPLS